MGMLAPDRIDRHVVDVEQPDDIEWNVLAEFGDDEIAPCIAVAGQIIYFDVMYTRHLCLPIERLHSLDYAIDLSVGNGREHRKT